jgi:uncharacterized membrane protein
MNEELPQGFRRRIVEPVACMKAGWNLVRTQYWLFVGITCVAMLLNGVVPFCILLGPMMCGIYFCMFWRLRGQVIEFGTLFKGFDYFGPSLIATLLHLIAALGIVFPIFTALMLGPLVLIPLGQGGEPNSAIVVLMMAFLVILGVLIFVIFVVFNVAATFVYPLIVDRQLSGVAAAKLSTKASLANFWQILGLLLLNALLGLAGALLCYVGLFLVLPINFAAIAIAYNQVFGLARIQSIVPPPPPVFPKS